MYQAILNSKKIKYDILNILLQPVLDKKYDEIVCYINLNSILKNFYGMKPDEVADDLMNIAPNALSSEIINIAAHYRHFFYSRYGLSSTFFFYYSVEMCDYCCEINSSFKRSFYEKRMGMHKINEYQIINEKIDTNLNFMSIITEYLPNIYYINTHGFEPYALPYLIIKKMKSSSSKIANIILTNELIDFQLVNYSNTYVVNLLSDRSKLITKTNLMTTLMKKSTKRNLTVDIPSRRFFIPCLALAGYKKWDLTGVKGMAQVGSIRLISKLLKNGDISDRVYLSMDDFLPFIKEEFHDRVQNNFKVLSYKNIAKNITNKEFIIIKKQMVNRNDNMSLLEINNKYYESNPLMTIELMEGEY